MASFVYDSATYAREELARAARNSDVANQLERLDIEILEWPAVCSRPILNSQQPARVRISVQDIATRPKQKVKIVLAPLDLIDQGRIHLLKKLYEHFALPAEFISERIHSVTHSFGSYDSDEYHVCWLHFLCKSIQLEYGSDRQPLIRDPRGVGLSQSDDTWLRSGCFLKWRHQGANSTDESEVSLVIFGPSPILIDLFEDLALKPAWDGTLTDPLNLLVVVLDSMFIQISDTINKLLKVVRAVEQDALKIAGSLSKNYNFDFVGMHNISKHTAYLKESSSAAFSTATRICDHHQGLMDRSPLGDGLLMMQAVHQLLSHKRTLIEGCNLRVSSIESRVQNMTTLAFNTVNQRDSQAIKVDSQAMKAIAIVTMLFLPATTVAGIYGSAFFDLDPGSRRVIIADDFGTFWSITLPITLVIFVAYGSWYSTGGGNVRTVIQKVKQKALRRWGKL